MHREKSGVSLSEYDREKGHRAGAYRNGGKSRSDGDKRKWIFWVVDITLVAVILAAVLFIVSLLTPFSLFGGGEELRGISYTVEFAGVNSSFVEKLQVGDVVTDAETGKVIGTVSAIDIRPYEVYTDVPSSEKDEELDSFVVTKITYPEGYHTIAVTIKTDAEYREGSGYTAGGTRIAVGRMYTLRLPAYTGEGECIGLEG